MLQNIARNMVVMMGMKYVRQWRHRWEGTRRRRWCRGSRWRGSPRKRRGRRRDRRPKSATKTGTYPAEAAPFRTLPSIQLPIMPVLVNNHNYYYYSKSILGGNSGYLSSKFVHFLGFFVVFFVTINENFIVRPKFVKIFVFKDQNWSTFWVKRSKFIKIMILRSKLVKILFGRSKLAKILG